MINPRKLAIARRCQLLVGSYTGASRICDCISGTQCHLSPAERKTLRDHPDVVAAKERNLEEWKKTYEGLRGD